MAEIILTKEQKDKARTAFVAFLEWKDKVHFEPYKLEFTVHNDRSAGTLDIVGLVDNSITVIDLKTSKVIFPEMKIQTAAYRHMYNLDINHPPATRNAVLRLDKTTGFPEYKDFSKTYLKDLYIYNCMVELYYARHSRIAKGAKIDIKI